MQGKIFGRLTVVRFSKKDKNYNKFWVCRCECGTHVEVRSDGLAGGGTQSCGCLRKENSMTAAHAARAKKLVGYGDRTYIRDSHRSMLRRCYDERHFGYKKYGARNITVCDRWRFGEGGKTGLDCFCEDMGARPQGMTIDRIDGTKGYYPENCRWATPKEQAANRAPRKRKIFDGPI